MAKANPKAWFVSPIAKITYRPVDKWAERMSEFRPYFPTWKDAHDWMRQQADERLRRANAELKRATAHREKVIALKEPV